MIDTIINILHKNKLHIYCIVNNATQTIYEPIKDRKKLYLLDSPSNKDTPVSLMKYGDKFNDTRHLSS